MNKRLTTYLASFGILLSAAVSLTGFGSNASAVVDNSPDCDNVAIIRCGTYSPSAIREKAAQGDVPRVFNALGISQNDLNGTFVNGVVWRDGRVTVNDRVVATNATTAGRNFGGTPINGVNNVGTYPTSRFATEGQTAFVKMNGNGTFDFAVIKACGNPVTAVPKPPKENPKSECVRLTAEMITRTKVRFTANATASGGATIERYEFGFGDGFGITVAERSYTYEYKQPGTFNTNVVVHVRENGQIREVTSPACERTVTITDEKIKVCDLKTRTFVMIDKSEFDSTKHSLDFSDCEIPPTPPTPTPPTPPTPIPTPTPTSANIQVCELATDNIITIKDSEFDATRHSNDMDDCEEVVPQVLAITGSETIVASLFGSGALGYGVFSYWQSRRSLINKLLGR